MLYMYKVYRINVNNNFIIQVITIIIFILVLIEFNVIDGVFLDEYQVIFFYGLLQNFIIMRKIGFSEFSEVCQYIIIIYVILNVFYFLVYIMGVVYFRIQENEQLYVIMEKVCIKFERNFFMVVFVYDFYFFE